MKLCLENMAFPSVCLGPLPPEAKLLYAAFLVNLATVSKNLGLMLPSKQEKQEFWIGIRHGMLVPWKVTLNLSLCHEHAWILCIFMMRHYKDTWYCQPVSHPSSNEACWGWYYKMSSLLLWTCKNIEFFNTECIKERTNLLVSDTKSHFVRASFILSL